MGENMVLTKGRVRTIAGVARMYIKPALGKIVIRKPGVERVSAKVLERNKRAVEAWSGPGGIPATCGGVPWDEFVKCLGKKAEERGLGTYPGISKTREYRMRFNKYAKAPRIPAPAPA